MVFEKTENKTVASVEGRVDDGLGVSVLDFLWHGEAPEAAATAVPGEVGQFEPGQASQPDALPAEGLKGALAHYSTWLSAWTKPA